MIALARIVVGLRAVGSASVSVVRVESVPGGLHHEYLSATASA